MEKRLEEEVALHSEALTHLEEIQGQLKRAQDTIQTTATAALEKTREITERFEHDSQTMIAAKESAKLQAETSAQKELQDRVYAEEQLRKLRLQMQQKQESITTIEAETAAKNKAVLAAKAEF